MHAAAILCLDQLRMLESGLAKGSEIGAARSALGGCLVAYGTALAGSWGQRDRHMPIRAQLVEVAKAPDPAKVHRGIEALERVLDGR